MEKPKKLDKSGEELFDFDNFYRNEGNIYKKKLNNKTESNRDIIKYGGIFGQTASHLINHSNKNTNRKW